MSDPQIQSGILAERSFQRAYVTQHGKHVYKVHYDGPGFGPGFELHRGWFGVGWRWKGWSHENVAMMRINVQGWRFRFKSAFGEATEETIRVWEEWESQYGTRTGRKVIAL